MTTFKDAFKRAAQASSVKPAAPAPKAPAPKV